ncbi:MAG: hypothetical protein JWN44_2626, partial [Myxococcales bacterium]|nr:hypothetical protein [Myxococcales bacterium]
MRKLGGWLLAVFLVGRAIFWAAPLTATFVVVTALFGGV